MSKFEIKEGEQLIVEGTIKWANLNPKAPGKGFNPGDKQWDFDFIPKDPSLFDAVHEAGFGSAVKTDKEGERFFKIKRKTVKKDGSSGQPFKVVSKYKGSDGEPSPWDWEKFPRLGNGTEVRVKLYFDTTTFNNRKFHNAKAWGVQILELKEYKRGEDFEAEEASGGEEW